MTWSFTRPWSLAAGVALAGMLPMHPLVRPRATEVVDPRLYAGLQWRNLGPFRGGRVAAVTGVIGQPGVFYAGYPAAGVWKTTSAGATWFHVRRRAQRVVGGRRGSRTVGPERDLRRHGRPRYRWRDQ